MKMATSPLASGAAGPKDSAALLCRQTGELEFLESAGGHGRDLFPMRHLLRGRASAPAVRPVNWNMQELKPEQVQRELRKRLVLLGQRHRTRAYPFDQAR